MTSRPDRGINRFSFVEVPRLLFISKVYYHIHKTRPLVHFRNCLNANSLVDGGEQSSVNAKLLSKFVCKCCSHLVSVFVCIIQTSLRIKISNHPHFSSVEISSSSSVPVALQRRVLGSLPEISSISSQSLHIC